MTPTLTATSEAQGTLVYMAKAIGENDTIVRKPATRSYTGPLDAKSIAGFASKVLGSAHEAREVSPGVFVLEAPKAPKGK